MTTFLLLRHAAHDNVGRFLAGRARDVSLGADGQAQARRLGERMRRESFELVQSSPRQRARQTASAVAETRPVEIADVLDEIDFGSWSGQEFDALNDDEDWRRWNAARSVNCTPGGDSMLDVQVRLLRHMLELRQRLPEGTAVLVSHADVIKAAVLHCLGLPIDAWSRFDIAPASITRIEIGNWGARVLGLNEVVS